MKRAYVSLVATDGFLPGVLALDFSLKNAGAEVPLLAMTVPGLTPKTRSLLHRFGIPMRQVEEIPHPGGIGRDHGWFHTFTKLRVFEQTQYDKVVFLDADVLVCKGIDELFEKPAWSAVNAGGLLPELSDWVDLNSGVLVVEPSQAVFDDLLRKVGVLETKTAGDQAFLHAYFPEWPERQELHLDHRYNLFQIHLDQYANRFGYKIARGRRLILEEEEDEKTVNVVHYIGRDKPWTIEIDSAATTDGEELLARSLELWWEIFRWGLLQVDADPELERLWNAWCRETDQSCDSLRWAHCVKEGTRRPRDGGAADRHVKIVLPCHDECGWLRATVDSILENTRYPSFEIFVMANGDTETDFDFLRELPYRERVSLKRDERTLGVGRCINSAVTPGDAAYYVFLDAHCLVEQTDWLDRAADCLEAHRSASMVQPAVHQFLHERVPSPRERLAVGCLEERARAYSIVWNWPYDDAHEIALVKNEPSRDVPYEAMAGGGMAVFARADTFHRLGRYDPEVDGWYPETMDYCVRAWMRGYPMVVDPTIHVWHRVQSSPVGRNLEDAIHGVLRTAYKYLSPRRRDLAEGLFRMHGFERAVDRILERVRRGRWLEERGGHLRARVHDDDWLFNHFDVYEERYGVGE